MTTEHTEYRPATDVTMAELFPNHDGLRPDAEKGSSAESWCSTSSMARG